jgi:hypothetical protein
MAGGASHLRLAGAFKRQPRGLADFKEPRTGGGFDGDALILRGDERNLDHD